MLTRRGLATGLAAGGLAACTDGRNAAALIDDGRADALVVMDFAPPLSLDALPAGWRHRTFWTRAPMRMSLTKKDGVDALRCETASSASMLLRDVDVALASRPRLSWRWFVELPIDSPLDERTREGDDHPARLFLSFVTSGGERRAMEIIWGNKFLARGDWKYLGSFPHYVANGGATNVGRWHAEEVDLARLTREAWPAAPPVKLVELGVFCDSDETRTRSIAYFARLALLRA